MRWRYWLDFCWLPFAVALPIALDCRSFAWVLWFALGAVAWTLNEYWTHRSLLHRVFWNSAHERHHRAPLEFVESIWWYTPPLFAALFFVLPLPVFAGFSAGYLWFLTMHHWLHHLDLRERTWLHRYAVWHNRHHKFTDCNYGITTSLWDRIFRTYR